MPQHASHEVMDDSFFVKNPSQNEKLIQKQLCCSNVKIALYETSGDLGVQGEGETSHVIASGKLSLPDASQLKIFNYYYYVFNRTWIIRTDKLRKNEHHNNTDPDDNG